MSGSKLFRSQCKYNVDYCDLIIEHMGEGHTLESFAGRVGIHPRTVQAWKHEHPEFDEAVEIGFRKALYYWEKIHMDAASGRSKGNAAAIIFKLKNTFKSWYKDRQEIDHSSYAQISVTTGINKGVLPDVEGEVIRKQIDLQAKQALESKEYVDFDTLQGMVLNDDKVDESLDDIL